MTAVRAPFACARRFSAADLLLDVAIGTTVGIPVPRPRLPTHDTGTKLPLRFRLEVDRDEIRVIEDSGEAVFERWQRGAVDAFVRRLDDYQVVLELRWPGTDRAGRIEAESSVEARRIAEVLAGDTRVRRGADPEANAALRELVAAGLADAVAVEHHRAVSALGELLVPGERPEIVAAAWRGLSAGLVLLTDEALIWCSSGRKAPLLLPRGDIFSAGVESPLDEDELRLETREAKTVRLGVVEPRGRAAEIAAAISARPPSRSALDELLAAEPDDSVTGRLRKQLRRAREQLERDELPLAFAIGLHSERGTRGALLATDRRLLWVPATRSAISIERERIAAAQAVKQRVVTWLDVTLADGDHERFAVEPRDRATALAAALVP